MAQTPQGKAAGPLKIAGGGVFLVASVGLMFHRMPHHEYVVAHADKPRPSPFSGAPAMAQAASPAAAQPASPAASRPATKPAPRAPEPPPPVETIPKTALEPVDLSYECRAEIGILCNHVPDKRLARCLGEYQDALLRPCRHALKSLQSSDKTLIIESDSGS